MTGAARALLAALLLLLPPAAARAAREEPRDKRVGVELDPALELLGAVQLLAGQDKPPHGFVAHPLDFEKELAAKLAPFKDSAAVRLTAALPAEAFDHMQRGDALVRLTPPPELAPRYTLPDLFVQDAGGKDKFEAWLSALRDFSRDAGFGAIFEDERRRFSPAADAFREELLRRDYIGKIERYAGLPFHGSYTFELTPYFYSGTMVNSVIRLEDGSYVVKTLTGPDQASGETLHFPTNVSATAWHELAHGTLDILGDLMPERVERSRAVYETLPWHCYNEWHQCVKEYAVRAVMIRLVALNEGEAAGERALRDEGERKWPYLRPMLERLKEYEARRDEYPDLGKFYPRLLDVFPKDKTAAPPADAAKAGPEPAGKPGDPGPEWAMDAAGPFPTDGQRRRALFYLDTLLSGGEDADLRLRRAALELLLREDGAALADAEAALARGKAPAPLLARALALRAAGRGEEAAADLAAAAALCRRGQGPALACANARRLSSSGSARTGTAWKEISAELAAAPSSASSGTAAPVTLSADPRLELLSAVWLLGRGAAADAELPSEVRSYAAEIRRRFSAQAAHPAVKRLARLLKEGKPPMAAAQLLLGVGAPPELSPVEVSYGGLGEEQTRAFLQELRDFARATRFAEFYAAHKAVYARWRATAEKEARGGLRPADAAAYLKTAFTATRFILAPALPSSFGANLTLPGADGPEQLRMRSDMEPGMPGLNFDFNDFAAGVAHELVHTVTDPAGLSRREELQVYASLAGPRCADSWLGCVLEQVDIAVTLRVLRRERGEAAYQAMLGEYTAAGFPQLQALCERLQEYEAGGDAYPTFDSFYPRLVEVFREALERRVRDQARRGLAAQGSGPAAPGASPAGSVRAADFAVDERVELAAALLAAGAAPAPCAGYCAQVREKFAPFSGHPAAAAARALAESDPSGTLLPRLLLQVSPPPRLLPAGPLPADLTARAGGPKAVESFLEAARAFSADSGFSAFFAAHRDDYDAWVRAARAERDRGLTAREAAAYLGGDAPAPLRFLLSPALPAGRAARFTAVGRDGVERVVLRAASYPEGKGPAFGLDTEQGSAAQAAADAVVESMLPAAPAAAAGAAELARACRDPRAPLWPVCAREVLTRAVTRRVAALSGKTAGPAAAGAGDSLEPLVEAAAGKLLEYEAARDRYKSLRDFYPRLVEAFVPRAAVRKPGAARGAEPRVSFSVDPRVELFSVLRLLGGHEPAAPDAAPLAYERAARDWFAPYAGDPAVALAAAMTAQDPQRDLPLQLLFHLSPDAALAAAEPVPDGYASAAGGPQAVEAWFAAVRAFARRSRFFDFYAARKADYARFAEQARDEARRSLSLKALPAYLGVDLDSEYDFVLAPLLPESEATNFTLLADDSVREIRLRAGTNSDSRGLRFMFDSFGNSPAHELVHTVTNPLVARAPLTGAPPRGCNDAQGPTAWTGCVQEHLVYAVTLRLLAREQGEEAAAKVLQEYEGRGFPYLAPLCQRLKAYEAGRKKWPTLADFYPRLEAVFRAAPPAGAAALSGDGPGRSAKEEGVRAFLAGRVDEAVARFRAAVAAEPGDVEALADLGVALEKKGDAAAALESYDRAVAAGLSRGASDWEHTAAALSSRATLLSAEGRDADARRDLEKALTLSPPDWSGRAELASRLKAMKGARP